MWSFSRAEGEELNGEKTAQRTPRAWGYQFSFRLPGRKSRQYRFKSSDGSKEAAIREYQEAVAARSRGQVPDVLRSQVQANRREAVEARRARAPLPTAPGALLTYRQAAALLNISYYHLVRLVSAGSVHVVRTLGPRHPRIHPNEMRRLRGEK